MPQDRVPFVTDEQFASADLVTLQRAAERALEQVTAFREHPYPLAAVGDSQAAGAQPSAAVLGGLGMETSGALLQVLPGALVTTNVPTPDNENPSGAYIAVNVERVDVALPSPLGDAWYIVAGRPVLVDAPAVARRVWDRPGKKWQDPTPSLVKFQTSEMVFDVVACPDPTQLSAVLPVNSVPLWGVFRPAGGGSINDATQVVDLRPVRAPHQAIAPCVQVLRNDWMYTTGNGLELAVHLRLDEVELTAHTSLGPIDPLLFKDPSDPAPADGEWWYLYLARHRPLGELCTPRHAQLNVSGLIQQGLVIFSKVPPRVPGSWLDRRPSAAITAPLPYSTNDTQTADAACFGALKRSGSSWLPCQCDDGRVTMMGNVTAPAATGSVNNFTFDHEAPLGARSVLLQIDTNAAATLIELARPDGTISLYRRPAPTTAEQRIIVDVPVVALGNSTTMRLSASTSGNWSHWMRGYRF